MALKKGDKVVTSGGVHGTIKVLRDKYVELEIAPRVVIKVEKSAIQHFEGKPAVGEAPASEVIPENKKSKKDEPETQVVEEVVEVDDPKDAGTEVIEEEVEVDDKDAAKDAEPKTEVKK